MEKVELKAKSRKEIGGRKARALRRRGTIPAVVYGKEISPIPLEINEKQFEKAISGEAGLNVIVSLKITEDSKTKTLPVITKDLQRNPLTDSLLHVDFYRISMEEEIKAKVPIVLIGECVGVKEEGGILIHGLREVEVKCLPTDIPGSIDIHISHLKLKDSLHVSDLPSIKGVTILSSSEEMLATISPPAKEEVVAPPVAPPEVVPAEAPTLVGAEEKAAPAPPPAGEAKEPKEKAEKKEK